MDPVKIPPDRASFYRTSYPAAVAYLEEHDYFVPDALKDTTNKRTALAEGVVEKMDRLKTVADCKVLILGELALGTLDHLPLYDKGTIKRAKKLVEAHFKKAGIKAFIWKLERGRNGGTHAHAILPADSDISGLISWDLLENEADELEAAKYLCKPPDARACGRRPKDLRVWTPEELEEQRIAAIDDFINRIRTGHERLRFLFRKGLGEGS